MIYFLLQETLEFERSSLMERRSNLKVMIEDLNSEVEKEKNARADASNELAEIRAEIENKEKELNELKPKLAVGGRLGGMDEMKGNSGIDWERTEAADENSCHRGSHQGAHGQATVSFCFYKIYLKMTFWNYYMKIMQMHTSIRSN